MRNAWRIFKGDVRLVATNAIGLMVAIGLVVVPALYAWFNIAGTWDPYENTGGLKVAVANEDAGYTSSLLPTDVNVGKSVVALSLIHIFPPRRRPSSWRSWEKGP